MFFLFNYSSPSSEVLHSIYNSILNQHWRRSELSFPSQIVRLADVVVQMTVTVHEKITLTFLPTAQKFHYIFNMNELTNLFQVMKLKF